MRNHTEITNQLRRALLPCLGVFLALASPGWAEEQGGLDLDSYHFDAQVKAELEKRFPAGTDAAKLKAALAQSTPSLSCDTSMGLMNCVGISRYGDVTNGITIVKEWTVTAEVPGNKVRAILVQSKREAGQK